MPGTIPKVDAAGTNHVHLHMALPETRRHVGASIHGLTGLPDEFSVKLNAIEGGPSDEWSKSKQYTGVWYGSSQAWSVQTAQKMLDSGKSKRVEAWYAAWSIETGELVDHNLPVPPTERSFDAFLASAGLERVLVVPPELAPIKEAPPTESGA